jgi:phage antirepressor YoqD-like protein
MNELTTEKTMTTKEVAEALGTRPNVITENAKKCLPNKVIENGKTTYWTQAEVTVLLEFMKLNNNRTDLDLSNRLIGSSTELTPALKLKKALELAQEAYEEELSILRAKNEAQEKQLIEQRPKVDFYDRVTESSDCIDIGQCAKVLNVHGIGRNKLFEILRNKKILNEHNQPYQKYVDCGYFRIIETSFNLPDGTQKINLKTVVFQKGVDFIRKMIEVAK